MAMEQVRIKQEEETLDEVKRGEGTPYSIGTKVRKFFPGCGWFTGNVTSYDGHLYRVVYNDGDREEYNHEELAQIVVSKSSSLSLNDLEKVKVGSRVAVYRSESDQYDEASVTRQRIVDKKPLKLLYDNGDKEWTDLGQRTFVLLEETTLRRGRRRNYDSTIRKSRNASNTDTTDTDGDTVKVKRRKRTKVYKDGEGNNDTDNKATAASRQKTTTKVKRTRINNSSQKALPPQVMSATKYAIGTKVKKYFKGYGWFHGEIVSRNSHYYRVLYGDGDAEDVSENDLEDIVVTPDLAKVHVGSRIAVHWPDDNMYYEATVTHERHGKKHRFRLAYEDSNQYEWLDLREHQFCLLGGVTRRRKDILVDDESDTDTDSDAETV